MDMGLRLPQSFLCKGLSLPVWLVLVWGAAGLVRTQTYKHKTWVRCLRKSLTDIPACPGTLSNSAR